MAGELSLTRRAALGSIAVGSGLLLAETGAFASVVADRSAGLDATDDGSALLSITGKTAESTPRFSNRASSEMTITLSATGANAEFDVVGEDKSGTQVEFAVAPSSSQEVEMSADASEITVSISGTFGNSSVEMTRVFEVPESTQIDIQTKVKGAGNGTFRFSVTNQGSNPIHLRSIRVDETDNPDTTEVANGEIFKIKKPKSRERQLLSSRLEVGSGTSLREFDGEDVQINQTDEVEFKFEYFRDDNGVVNMNKARVTLTLGFSDGSTLEETLDASN